VLLVPAARAAAVEELSLEQCRRIAAEFLGVAAGELVPRPRGAKSESDWQPTTYAFILPHPKESQVEEWLRALGRAAITVEAQRGEVLNVDYEPRRYEIGQGQLSEAEAKGIADSYLETHWPHWTGARFYSATKPSTPNPAARPLRAPAQSFRWVVEENGIRVGEAGAQVNLSTGKVVSYTQHYYSAQGLPPARLSKQQAISALLERLDERQRASAKVQEAYLATCWYTGRVRLSWVIYAQAPARVPPGYRGKPPVRTQGLQLDAHTGEVYLEVK